MKAAPSAYRKPLGTNGPTPAPAAGLRRVLRLVAIGAATVVAAAGVPSPHRATSGTLVISTDTTLTQAHQGEVVIAADNVTLDCAGYSIAGSGQQAGLTVEARSTVTIRNCRVGGFLSGVFVVHSSQVRLEGNQSSDNDEGFYFALSDHIQAGDNTARANRQNGFVLADSTDSAFTGNRATGNGHNGFLLTDSDGNALTANVAEDNMGFGFALVASDGNSLAENVGRRNDTGFTVEVSTGNRLDRNIASDNRRRGFHLARVYLTRLTGNRAVGNLAAGFHVEQSGVVDFEGNASEGNGGYELAVEETVGQDFHEFVTEAAEGGAAPGRRVQGRFSLELVSFLGLLSTIWLGLYLFGQPQRRPVTWLTTLTLWSLAGDFLEDFLAFNEPAVGLLHQLSQALPFWPEANQVVARLLTLGWLDFPAVVFWFHATTLLRPGGMTRRRRPMVVVGYLLAATAVVTFLFRPEWMAPPGPGAGLSDLLELGSLFVFLAASLILFSGLCVWNLIVAVRGAHSAIVRRQFTLLLGSTLIGGLSGLIYVLGGVYSLPIPAVAEGVLLWLAVVLLGYGVAQYSAVVEGRTIRRHFIASLAGVALVSALYLAVSYLSSLSFGVRTAVYAFVVLLAVVTHSLAGNARAILDYFFVDPQTRRVLQVLRRMSSGLHGPVEDQLGMVLDQLCTQLRASYGVLLLRSDQAVRLAASYRWDRPRDVPLQPQALSKDDLQTLPPGALPAPLDDGALLAPVYIDAESVGAVVLGHPLNGLGYTRDEAELTGYATDRISEILRLDRQQHAALGGLAHLPAAVNPVALPLEGEPSLESVETALRRINDFVFLGATPLAQLQALRGRLPPGATHIDVGKAAHQVLVETIEKLRPAGQKPALSSPREWHHYMILHEAYVVDRPNREVMADLYISEGTFNRRRREAVNAVTRILREQEEAGGAA